MPNEWPTPRACQSIAAATWARGDGPDEEEEEAPEATNDAALRCVSSKERTSTAGSTKEDVTGATRPIWLMRFAKEEEDEDEDEALDARETDPEA